MSLSGMRTSMFSSHQESPSCPSENRPFGTRKNQASFPFHSGNPTTFSSIFNFQFSDSMTSVSVSASKPLLLLFHSAISLSLINQAFFLFSWLFSKLKKELGKAWEWDAWEGDRGKKRSRARRISLKFIWLCFIFFMFFFTRTLGWVWVGREHHHSNSTTTNQFCLEIICYRICLSFNSLICPYYPACIS